MQIFHLAALNATLCTILSRDPVAQAPVETFSVDGVGFGLHVPVQGNAIASAARARIDHFCQIPVQQGRTSSEGLDLTHLAHDAPRTWGVVLSTQQQTISLFKLCAISVVRDFHSSVAEACETIAQSAAQTARLAKAQSKREADERLLYNLGNTAAVVICWLGVTVGITAYDAYATPGSRPDTMLARRIDEFHEQRARILAAGRLRHRRLTDS